MEKITTTKGNKKSITVGVAKGVAYNTNEGVPTVTLTIVGNGAATLGAFCDAIRHNSKITIEYNDVTIVEHGDMKFEVVSDQN